MPIPNVNIQVNQSVVIHSNPRDAANNAAVLPSDVTWATDTNQFGSLTLQGGPLNPDAKFSATSGQLGVTTITMACAGKTAQYQVTTVPGPFDHFSPSNDAPTTP